MLHIKHIAIDPDKYFSFGRAADFDVVRAVVKEVFNPGQTPKEEIFDEPFLEPLWETLCNQAKTSPPDKLKPFNHNELQAAYDFLAVDTIEFLESLRTSEVSKVKLADRLWFVTGGIPNLYFPRYAFNIWELIEDYSLTVLPGLPEKFGLSFNTE